MQDKIIAKLRYYIRYQKSSCLEYSFLCTRFYLGLSKSYVPRNAGNIYNCVHNFPYILEHNKKFGTVPIQNGGPHYILKVTALTPLESV